MAHGGDERPKLFGYFWAMPKVTSRRGVDKKVVETNEQRAQYNHQSIQDEKTWRVPGLWRLQKVEIYASVASASGASTCFSGTVFTDF